MVFRSNDEKNPGVFDIRYRKLNFFLKLKSVKADFRTTFLAESDLTACALVLENNRKAALMH